MKKLIVFTCIFVALSGTAVAQSGSLGDVPTTPEKELNLKEQIEVLKKIELQKGPRFSLVGRLAAERGKNAYSINGEKFVLSPEVRVEGGTVHAGAFAEVTGPFTPTDKVAEAVTIFPEGKSEDDSDSSSLERTRF